MASHSRPSTEPILKEFSYAAPHLAVKRDAA
jgi:hypothetical protein